MTDPTGSEALGSDALGSDAPDREFPDNEFPDSEFSDSDAGAGDAPATGRAGGEDQRHGEVEETVNRESQPNAGGPAGLAGDMGLSSERQGPFEGIEATGSLVSAQHTTDGESPPAMVPDHEDTPVATDAAGTGAPGPEGEDDTSPASGVDRTVGEVRPNPVANKHEFDPSKNPGH